VLSMISMDIVEDFTIIDHASYMISRLPHEKQMTSTMFLAGNVTVMMYHNY